MDVSVIEHAWTTEGAISILKMLLSKGQARANGKTIMKATIDAALCRGIMALEKELEQEKKDD